MEENNSDSPGEMDTAKPPEPPKLTRSTKVPLHPLMELLGGPATPLGQEGPLGNTWVVMVQSWEHGGD